jgi:hypothetical protein
MTAEKDIAVGALAAMFKAAEDYATARFKDGRMLDEDARAAAGLDASTAYRTLVRATVNMCRIEGINFGDVNAVLEAGNES